MRKKIKEASKELIECVNCHYRCYIDKLDITFLSNMALELYLINIENARAQLNVPSFMKKESIIIVEMDQPLIKVKSPKRSNARYAISTKRNITR